MIPLIYHWLVSPEFCDEVRSIAAWAQTDPDFLMADMHFETGGSYSPSVRNGAGSGGTGLIQFMPKTAEGLGTTTDELASMTALEQLKYVRAYFKPYRGKMNTLEDSYMAILLPSAIGKPLNHVLIRADDKPFKRYIQNKGLDLNKDELITKAEAAAKVRGIYKRGIAERARRLVAESSR